MHGTIAGKGTFQGEQRQANERYSAPRAKTLREFNPDRPEELHVIVSKALEKNRTHRYQLDG
jgi:hypothetical protein